MSGDKFNYLDKQFEDLVFAMFGGITLPDRQRDDLKAAFFAGAKVTLDYIMSVCITAENNESGVTMATAAIDDIDKEINDNIDELTSR